MHLCIMSLPSGMTSQYPSKLQEAYSGVVSPLQLKLRDLRSRYLNCTPQRAPRSPFLLDPTAI